MKKQKTMRSLLLSLISLLISFTMLVGSTFAWFTDSVVSKNNIITSGNLDVELEYSFDGETWDTVTETTSLFNPDALWEPGHTEVVALKVKNVGSLALKYQLKTNVYLEEEGVNVYGETFKLSDYLVVGHSAIQQDNVVGDILMGMATSSREDAIAACSAELAFNEAIDIPSAYIQPGEGHVVALVVYMPTEVGNEANHDGEHAPVINFGVELVATQYSYESDSFGPDYDANATFPVLVNSEAELKAALTNGKDVVLGSNVAVDGDTTITVAAGKTATLDLNGHKLTSTTVGTGSNRNVFDVQGTLNVENGEIEYTHTGANMGWGSSTNVFNVTNGGVLNIKNATIKNLGGSDMAFVAHLNNWGEVTLNVENSTLESPYVAVRVFNSGNDMNNVTIKNSTVKGGSNAMWVHNYTLDDFGTQAKVDAHKALLNFDIAEGNTFIGSNAAPIRLGFTNGSFVNADFFGN